MGKSGDIEKASFRKGSVGFFINDWRDGIDISEPFDITNIELGYRLYCRWFEGCAYKPHRADLYEYKQVVAWMSGDSQ